MYVICQACERRLEWSAKRDRPLRSLVCPHCGADQYRRQAGYLDLGSPEVVQRRALDIDARIRQSLAKLQEALREVRTAIPLLAIEAEEVIEQLQQPRLKLVKPASKGGVA
jgi:hypothetical protein